MAFHMLSISSSGDSFTLDRYVHKYRLSIMHGVTLPFPSSSSILEPLAGNVGFYLRHLVSGLRLPPRSFFIEVLYSYGAHLIHLYPKVVSKVITFEVFCVSSHILLYVSLFRYF